MTRNSNVDQTIFFHHEFESEVVKFGIGKTRKVWYNVIFLPKNLERELPFKKYPRLRIIGEINGYPIEGAWIPSGEKSHYLILSGAFLKRIEAVVGDTVELRFNVDDQDRVDVPEELSLAIAQNKLADRAWKALSAGKKRGYCHMLGTAKSESTKHKRIEKIIVELISLNSKPG